MTTWRVQLSAPEEQCVGRRSEAVSAATTAMTRPPRADAQRAVVRGAAMPGGAALASDAPEASRAPRDATADPVRPMMGRRAV